MGKNPWEFPWRIYMDKCGRLHYNATGRSKTLVKHYRQRTPNRQPAAVPVQNCISSRNLSIKQFGPIFSSNILLQACHLYIDAKLSQIISIGTTLERGLLHSHLSDRLHLDHLPNIRSLENRLTSLQSPHRSRQAQACPSFPLYYARRLLERQ